MRRVSALSVHAGVEELGFDRLDAAVFAARDRRRQALQQRRNSSVRKQRVTMSFTVTVLPESEIASADAKECGKSPSDVTLALVERISYIGTRSPQVMQP